MRRGYTNAEYRDKIARIRERIPNVSLATDLIVGFCGETDEQFQRTADLVRDIGFDKVHAAAYSTRPGTIAARLMEDDVPQTEKKRRLKVIEEIQKTSATRINAKPASHNSASAGRRQASRSLVRKKPQRQAGVLRPRRRHEGAHGRTSASKRQALGRCKAR